MSYIAVNQDALQIKLDTGINLSAGISSVKVCYKKPDGKIGEWAAEIDGTSVVKTMSPGGRELDQAGEWSFWSKVNFLNGTSAPGLPVKQRVYIEGKV
jgi:hypothetical protein